MKQLAEIIAKAVRRAGGSLVAGRVGQLVPKAKRRGMKLKHFIQVPECRDAGLTFVPSQSSGDRICGGLHAKTKTRRFNMKPIHFVVCINVNRIACSSLSPLHGRASSHGKIARMHKQ